MKTEMLPVRTTRSKAKDAVKVDARATEPPTSSAKDYLLKSMHPTLPIRTLPQALNTEDTGLSSHDQRLLQSKQRRLRLEDFSHPAQYQPESHLLDAAKATLVFAQEAAGTAVCISPYGLLLTCSHCVAASPEELQEEIRGGAKVRRWLLFASGAVVEAELVTGAWDDRRDLALLGIVAAQRDVSRDSTSELCRQEQNNDGSTFSFPHTAIATSPPRPRDSLICVGHPGSEDLEASAPGLATGYDVLHISDGRFRGYAKGQNLQDNSEIGALKHDCWTYWGHSGASLLDQKTGRLVGLHSSWDEATLMRRGVPLEAIQRFLEDYTALVLD